MYSDSETESSRWWVEGKPPLLIKTLTNRFNLLLQLKKKKNYSDTHAQCKIVKNSKGVRRPSILYLCFCHRVRNAGLENACSESLVSTEVQVAMACLMWQVRWSVVGLDLASAGSSFACQDRGRGGPIRKQHVNMNAERNQPDRGVWRKPEWVFNSKSYHAPKKDCLIPRHVIFLCLNSQCSVRALLDEIRFLGYYLNYRIC